jgi:general secretion pathway protein A
MVLEYYNLKEQPFGVTPDPRYLYSSASHREALATLSYGIRSRRGFMSLIAKPGMGKTTILFRLLSELEGSARTVFLFQTLCSPKDLLRDLLRDLGITDDSDDAGRMHEKLNRLLLAEAREGRRVVVVVDEAQNLEDSALEMLRMLSNFETTSYKLMQIILSGQPQLREKLASPQLLQLRQRMSIFARLHPFSAEETDLYVRHRLRVAGYDFKTPLFTPQAAALIAKYSEGIPRNINNICFNAISLGCVLKQKTIREEVVRECLDDMGFEEEGPEQTGEEAAGSKVFAFQARQPKPVSRQSIGWGKKAAVSVVLLFLSVMAGGRQSEKRRSEERLDHQSLLAASATSRMDGVQEVSAAPTNPLSPTGPGVDGEREFMTESMPAISPGKISESSPVLSSRAIEKLPQQPNGKAGSASDPAQLWAEVKNENSDAEVDLALLYMEGTAVPQNCAQAKILLLAASRRGNTHATEVLSDAGSQCR